MSSWVGFTDRLRRHGRSIDVKPTTRGYIDVAADRIDDLESKLLVAQNRVNFLDHSLFQLRKGNS